MTKRTTVIISTLFIICFLFISGCNQINAPTEVDIFGRTYIDLLHKADFETAIQSHASNIANIEISKMDELTKPIQEEPFTTELIQSNKDFLNQNRFNLFYDITVNNKYYLLTLTTDNTSGTNQIAGLYIKPLDKSAKELSIFSLNDKTLTHYLIFAFAIIIPLFILITLIICIKTPIKKRKWLWVIFILLGIGTIKLNWTTGGVDFQPISVLLFGVGGMKDIVPTEPWIISIAMPIGALIFLLQRNKIKQTITPKTIAQNSIIPRK